MVEPTKNSFTVHSRSDIDFKHLLSQVQRDRLLLVVRYSRSRNVDIFIDHELLKASAFDNLTIGNVTVDKDWGEQLLATPENGCICRAWRHMGIDEGILEETISLVKAMIRRFRDIEVFAEEY